MTKINELHKKWLKDPEYRAAYDALEEEFALTKELIQARVKAETAPEDVAQATGKTQALPTPRAAAGQAP